MEVGTVELITRDEAREAIRNTALSDAAVDDLIRGAREAAEDFLRFHIAVNDVDTEGWSAEELPRTIKHAMYYWMACTNEMMPPNDWLPGFYVQLRPWRDHPCG